MARYGHTTSVPVERSQAEIRKILNSEGCENINTMEADAGYAVEFIFSDRLIRFMIKYPSWDDPAICETDGGRIRSESQIEKAYEQEVRRLYRALCMCIKMKFEIVESGISCFEEEFLAHTVDPVTKQTYGTMLKPMVEQRLIGADHSPTLRLPAP